MLLYPKRYCMFYANPHKSLEVSRFFVLGVGLAEPRLHLHCIVLFWRCQLDYLSARFPLIEERFCLAENVQSACCPPSVFSVNAHCVQDKFDLAHKNKSTACMHPSAGEDHSIPIIMF